MGVFKLYMGKKILIQNTTDFAPNQNVIWLMLPLEVEKTYLFDICVGNRFVWHDSQFGKQKKKVFFETESCLQNTKK